MKLFFSFMLRCYLEFMILIFIVVFFICYNLEEILLLFFWMKLFVLLFVFEFLLLVFIMVFSFCVSGFNEDVYVEVFCLLVICIFNFLWRNSGIELYFDCKFDFWVCVDDWIWIFGFVIVNCWFIIVGKFRVEVLGFFFFNFVMFLCIK